MKILVDTYNKTKTLHHACVIEGEHQSILPKLLSFFENTVGLKTIGNPDFVVNTFDTFAIDDSRALWEQQSCKSLSDKKIFILIMRAITRETQNAILKMLEEPTLDTHFFIIIPRADALLPTVLSRVLVISDFDHENIPMEKEVKKFLQSSKSERLAFVKEMVDEKDKAKALMFLNSMEKLLAGDSVKNRESLKTVLFAKQYIQDTSSSVKLLLEYVALGV